MENRLLNFAKLALTVAQRILPEHAHKFCGDYIDRFTLAIR